MCVHVAVKQFTLHLTLVNCDKQSICADIMIVVITLSAVKTIWFHSQNDEIAELQWVNCKEQNFSFLGHFCVSTWKQWHN